MAIHGSTATVRAQTPQSAAFRAAWDYIGTLLDAGSAVHRRVGGLARGESQKHELGAGVFAIEQAYDSKPRAEAFFESHRKYVDIQVVVAGEEAMEVIDAAHASVREPYQAERDLIVYHDAPNASRLHLQAGAAAVFFPADVHMPSLRAGDAAVLVRKVVLKVPVEG